MERLADWNLGGMTMADLDMIRRPRLDTAEWAKQWRADEDSDRTAS
jgi:hypothetical protein